MQGISLKAQLELQRQSYRKAARILTISPNAAQAPEGTPSPDRPNQDSKAAASKGASDSRAGLERPSQQDGARRVGMLSNMGCVQHALGKSNTAALCFAQALRAQAQTSGQEQVSTRDKSCCLVFCTYIAYHLVDYTVWVLDPNMSVCVCLSLCLSLSVSLCVCLPVCACVCVGGGGGEGYSCHAGLLHELAIAGSIAVVKRTWDQFVARCHNAACFLMYTCIGVLLLGVLHPMIMIGNLGAGF